MPRKTRLLIVEDEVAIRSGLTDLFVFHGYEVEAAADGREGLRKALGGGYDLLLLDVMLPGMDGFEICNRVRAVDPEQPIVMLTAKTSDEDIVRGLTLGADDYVAKPFSVTQLVLRVKAVLRRARALGDDLAVIRLGDGLEIDSRNLSGRQGARRWPSPGARWRSSSTWRRTASARSRGRNSCTGSGVTPVGSTSRRGPWTSTSPSSAARSRPTRRNRATW
jgi:CheY-like chemotaxis protein